MDENPGQKPVFANIDTPQAIPSIAEWRDSVRLNGLYNGSGSAFASLVVDLDRVVSSAGLNDPFIAPGNCEPRSGAICTLIKNINRAHSQIQIDCIYDRY